MKLIRFGLSGNPYYQFTRSVKFDTFLESYSISVISNSSDRIFGVNYMNNLHFSLAFEL